MYFLFLQLCSSICHLGLTKLYLMFLQTAFSLYLTNYIYPYLANCTCFSYKLSSCKFLQIVILLLVKVRWIVTYGLIAHGAEVDLKSFFLVKDHFNGLSSDEVSKDPIFSHCPLF